MSYVIATSAIYRRRSEMYGSWGGWGAHYTNGSLVFTRFPDGEFGLAVVIGHTGDYHHKSVRVQLANNADTPSGKLRLLADPTEEYYSYYMGPTLCVLSTAQILSLVAGIEIDIPTREIDFRTVLSMQSPGFKGPYKSSK